MQYYRPMGLSVVAVLWWIAAGLAALAGLLLFGLGATASSLLGDGSAFAIGLFLGLLCMAFAGLGLAVGMGLWRMQTWAWWVAVILTAITLFLSILSLLAVPLFFISFGAFLLLLIYAGTLIYLCSREARESCGVVSAAYGPASSQGRPAIQMSRPALGAPCPNPKCRQPLRHGWQFCPYCTTRVTPSREPSRLR